MPNPLLQITLRSDWQELTRDAALRRLRLWRAAEIAVATVTSLVLAIQLLFPSGPGDLLLRLALFVAVLWLVPLWTLYRSEASKRKAARAALAAGAVLGGAAVAATLVLRLASVGAGGTAIMLAAWVLSFAVPASTLALLWHANRRFPAAARSLGLVFDNRLTNIVIGLTAGLALGFHMLLTASFIPGVVPWEAPAPAHLVWTVVIQASLLALGVELFFRGFAYSVLLESPATLTAGPALKLVLLNLVLYLSTWLLTPPSPAALIWLLAYGVLLIVLMTFLRHRQGNLLPGMVCHVVFTLFATTLIGP